MSAMPTGADRLSLLGASFSGGVCAYYAAKRPAELDRLVLLNPQLDYKRRTIDSRPYWHDDRLDDEMAHQLLEHGYIQFTPTLRHGRPILNEVFWFEPLAVLGEIAAPTLVVHGTKDTFVPIDASREAMALFMAEHQLVEIEGSQHGFAVHDDPQYLNPQSQAWQALVIRTVADVDYREFVSTACLSARGPGRPLQGLSICTVSVRMRTVRPEFVSRAVRQACRPTWQPRPAHPTALGRLPAGHERIRRPGATTGHS